MSERIQTALDQIRAAFREQSDGEAVSLWKRLRHRVAHWLGWNGGTVTTWWAKTTPPQLMVGFRCCECGQVQSISPVYNRETPAT